jgi:hypothetical protein
LNQEEVLEILAKYKRQFIRSSTYTSRGNTPWSRFRPSPSFSTTAGGPQVTVYDKGVVHLRRLDIAADNGATIEVQGCLHAGDQLILIPPIGATEGMRATTAPERLS